MRNILIGGGLVVGILGVFSFLDFQKGEQEKDGLAKAEAASAEIWKRGMDDTAEMRADWEKEKVAEKRKADYEKELEERLNLRGALGDRAYEAMKKNSAIEAREEEKLRLLREINEKLSK